MEYRNKTHEFLAATLSALGSLLAASQIDSKQCLTLIDKAITKVDDAIGIREERAVHGDRLVDPGALGKVVTQCRTHLKDDRIYELRACLIEAEADLFPVEGKAANAAVGLKLAGTAGADREVDENGGEGDGEVELEALTKGQLLNFITENQLDVVPPANAKKQDLIDLIKEALTLKAANAAADALDL